MPVTVAAGYRPRGRWGAGPRRSVAGLIQQRQMGRVRQRHHVDVLMLCYHAVSESWESPLAVTPESLRRQVVSLRERGFHPGTFSEVVRRRPQRNTMVITFDDGYRNVFEHALPILSELETPATVFVPTDIVGTERPMSWPGIAQWIGGPHGSELVAMDWPQLRALAESGWEIGSHTCSHAVLPDLADAELDAELAVSRLACERHLGRACESIAYPFGRISARVVGAARRAGYTTGGALRHRRWYGDDPLCRPRLGIMRDETDAHFRRHTSRTMRRLAASPASPLLFPAARWTVTALRHAKLRR